MEKLLLTVVIEECSSCEGEKAREWLISAWLAFNVVAGAACNAVGAICNSRG